MILIGMIFGGAIVGVVFILSKEALKSLIVKS
jgi:hypothetical protein